MKIFLAPMDGLTDHIMRDTLTRIGGVDVCVTEFVRITSTLLPEKVYYRMCPELHHGGKTPSGVPVRIQLLGSDPSCLADNASLAASLGAPGIDLNFGCPAKTVNRNNGGAVLLTDPDNLYNIVKTVRQTMPETTPLSAKMRLGYEDKSLALACAEAIEAGGANELVVHARTKTEGYKPPAYWDWIAKIKEVVSLPVVANGEIWTYQDYLNCKEQSRCDDVMLGRGLLSNPSLANECKNDLHNNEACRADWGVLLGDIELFFDAIREEMDSKCSAGRLKQWLRYLVREYTEAEGFFDSIRKEKNPLIISEVIKDTRLRYKA